VDAEWAVWAAVLAACVAMLAVDLRLGPREGAPLRSAVAWSVGWLVVGVVVALPVWALHGGTAAGEYVTGYAIERSLSLDNVFVFAVIFTALAVPAALRPPALTFGIGAALVLRGRLHRGRRRLAGGGRLDRLPAGCLPRRDRHPDRRDSGHGEAGSRVLAVVGRLPLGDRPLVAALVALALADVAFAVDSIPAVFAVTRDPLVVFAANAMALVGLRQLYVVLEAMRSRFEYVHLGLGAVLVVVGAEMALADLYHPPAWASLLVVVGILAVAVAALAARVIPSPVRSQKGSCHESDPRIHPRHRRHRRPVRRAVAVRRRPGCQPPAP
jgi:tellurite resistance protein TerC